MTMRLIDAPNMKKAMIRIHDEIGPEAVIYEANTHKDGVSVLAGLISDESVNTPTMQSIDQFNVLDSAIQALSCKVDGLYKNYNTHYNDNYIKEQYESYFKSLGFSEHIIQDIFHDFINSQTSIRNSLFNVESEIIKKMNILDNDFVENGGIHAFIGPTGAGKTTTIIKMANKFLENNSSSDLEIITTDLEEKNIKNKLNYFCQQNGLTLNIVKSVDDLKKLIKNYKSKKLILIDTHGVNQYENLSVARLIGILSSKKTINYHLVIPCNQQEIITESMVKEFNNITSCILTKIDETNKLAVTLGVLIKNKLSISYLCNGQHVIKNLLKADHNIITKMLDLIPMLSPTKKQNKINKFKKVYKLICNIFDISWIRMKKVKI